MVRIGLCSLDFIPTAATYWHGVQFYTGDIFPLPWPKGHHYPRSATGGVWGVGEDQRVIAPSFGWHCVGRFVLLIQLSFMQMKSMVRKIEPTTQPLNFESEWLLQPLYQRHSFLWKGVFKMKAILDRHAYCPRGSAKTARARIVDILVQDLFHLADPFQRKSFSYWMNLVGGIPTPLKNDGVRQIASSSQPLGKITAMFNLLDHQLGTLRLADPKLGNCSTREKLAVKCVNQSEGIYTYIYISHSIPILSLSQRYRNWLISSLGESHLMISIYNI